MKSINLSKRIKRGEIKMAEPVSMVTFYLLSSLASALISSINGRKQRKLTKQTTEQSLSAQRNNISMQLDHQRLLHEEGYKQQIAHQLRAYKLSNSWPLADDPQSIAEAILSKEKVPLFLVFAPMEKGGIQGYLGSVWTNVGNLLMTQFAINSERPVIEGRYKSGWAVNPRSDFSTIWQGLSEVPTLYIAPYSTQQTNILGFTVAFWGMNSTSYGPAVKNFEIDIRKLYIDKIRKDTEEFKKLCDEGILNKSEHPVQAKNVEVFDKEKETLKRGLETKFYNGNNVTDESLAFQYLDQRLSFYKDVKPTTEVYSTLSRQIETVITALSCYIVDMYFVLEYGTTATFPQIAKTLNDHYSLPDLLVRGVLENNNKFNVLSGKEFLTQLATDFSNFTEKNKAISVSVEKLNGHDGRRTLSEAFELLHKQKYEEAFRLLRDLSKEDPNALAELGLCYLDGLGCDPSLKDAHKCFKSAIDKGAAKGEQYMSLYRSRVGEESDNTHTGEDVFEDSDALLKLGKVKLAQGNYDDAFFCIELAAREGNEEATEYLKEIRKLRG